MNPNKFNLKNEIYSNYNSILLEIINNLHQLRNYSKDDLCIKVLGDVINKLNYFYIDIKKNFELIRKDMSVHMSTICEQMNKRFDKLDNNSIIIQELQLDDGKYIGQTVNGEAEGKGVRYFDIGDRYEGEFKNNRKEGKGIYYHHNGERYEGDIKNGKMEGKGIYYYDNGERYEGDFRNNKKDGKGIYYYNNNAQSNGDIYVGDYKNGKKEGKGIYYFSNGDRMMGDYYKDRPVGMHIKLTRNKEVIVQNY